MHYENHYKKHYEKKVCLSAGLVRVNENPVAYAAGVKGLEGFTSFTGFN